MSQEAAAAAPLLSNEVSVAIVTGIFLVIVATLQLMTNSRLKKVNHELNPNSGKTLRDQTNRIESRFAKQDSKLNKDHQRLAALEAKTSENTGAINAVSAQLDLVIKLLREKK